MSTESLCLRTFAEAVRSRMNKKSVIKYLDPETKFAILNSEERDTTGVFVFYSLLLECLSYTAEVDGVEGIPDISKTQTTYLKSGQSPVPDKFIEIAQRKSAVADVSACFAINLIPNIPKCNQNVVLDAVLAITQNDDSIGKTKQKAFKALRKEKAPADFLAEAFVLAVCVGKNKVDCSMEAADEIAPLIKNIDDIQVKLNAIPKVVPLTPPQTPAEHERQYISALYDAYDDAAEGETLPSDDITQHPKFDKDLKQRRIEYFAAEAVRRGTRENFRNNDPDNLFTALMSETLDGVSDVHAMGYRHGFERLLSVMKHATALHFENCILGRIPDWVGPSQKKGVCHMLVNEGQIKGWVNDDE